MNINEGYKKISSIELLKKHLLAYSKIDCIMCSDEEELKVYHYYKNWIENGHFFKIDDSGGDHYHILISQDGCIIKGFDHECELSPYNFEENEPMAELISKHDFYNDAPLALQELLNDPALEKNNVTFCVWQVHGQTQWHFEPLKIPNNWNDGIETFLQYIPDLQDYKKWFEDDYYEANLDFYLLEKIYNNEAITADMVRKLNPKADIQIVFKNLEELF